MTTGKDALKDVATGTAAAKAATGLIAVEQQRAIAEVQAAMMVARSLPRDRVAIRNQILNDCTDPGLAEQAEYEYSRGGADITGPSIRLLETIARRWGNMECGIRELSRRDGYSEFQAYAWDLESNFRDTKVFQVRHWRDTKQGGYAVSEERDVYEVGANQGARRKRACMEAVIPSDLVREAVHACRQTLTSKVEVTPDLIASILAKFATFHVSQAQIEERIQRKLDAMQSGHAVQLGRIYNSLKDGMSQPGDWFAPAPDGGKQTLAKASRGKKKDTPPPATQQQAGAGGPTADQVAVDVRRIIAAAKEIKDNEVAMLKMDDARAIVPAGEPGAALRKEIDDATREIQARGK